MADVPNNSEASSEGAPKLRVAAGNETTTETLNFTPARRTPSRLVAWFRGWSHEHFNPERIGAFLKTLLWVAPLTILIWIYAERQQQYRQGDIAIPIQVESDDPNKIVEILGDGNVVIEVLGPKAAIDRMRERFSPMMGNPPGQIHLDRSLSGPQKISAVRIGEDKRFVDAGITVLSARPGSIELMVDNKDERDVPVELRPDQRQHFVKQPTFTPPTVKVRGPEGVLRAESEAKRLVAYADLGDRVSETSAMSELIRLDNVKLSLAFQNKYVTFTPNAVSVVVEPTPPKEWIIPSVRLAISAPESILNRYEIHALQENLFNVKVSGPPQLIDALQQANTAPQASLELPAADPGEVDIDADVKYQFPVGVVVKEGPTKVKVSLKRR